MDTKKEKIRKRKNEMHTFVSLFGVWSKITIATIDHVNKVVCVLHGYYKPNKHYYRIKKRAEQLGYRLM